MAAGSAAGPSRRTAVVGLAVILGVSALLSTWNLGYVGLSPYYAAAAKSMAASPRALAFGALDPAASITLDKLSGFLLPQALSVAVLGFHPWALALPQVLEGLVTVAAGFVIGRRWRGTGYGLAIAAILAFTPVLAAMSGRPTEDGMATMCQVLAFAALQRSIHTDRLRWLIVAGLWVGVGFQAKMMASWLLLPAFVVVALVGGRAPIRTRVLRVALALGVAVIASLAWMTAIQAVPPAARPFIDGTTDDDVFSMVFGYDGFDRFLPGIVPGAVPQLHGSAGSAAAALNRTRTGAAGSSVLKLLMPQLTTQIGWLYPCAGAGIAFSAMETGRRLRMRSPDRLDRDQDLGRAGTRAATEIGLAVWLATGAAVLSLAFVPHATYVGVIALPIAAFAVHGAVRATAAYRAGRAAAVLPLLVAVQSLWAASIVAFAPAQLRWVLVTVLVAGAVSVAALVLAKRRPRPRLAVLGLVAGLVVSVTGPATWSVLTIGSGGGGSASDAFAGPPIGADGSLPLLTTGRRAGLVVVHRPFSVPPGPHLSTQDAALLRYVSARNRPHAIPFASDSLPTVVSVLIGSADSPLPMGGYSHQAPDPSLPALRRLVATGRLRFLLLQRADPRTAAPTNPVLAAERAWVGRRCGVVRSERFPAPSGTLEDLYDCAVPAQSVRVVP